ncbi:MAG TPA: hypothetical protein VLB82_07725 [Thermodesulfobacteriota bacterium]|nr:hypothetical protein [Thermodesulfobacteriota bacterium]
MPNLLKHNKTGTYILVSSTVGKTFSIRYLIWSFHKEENSVVKTLSEYSSKVMYKVEKAYTFVKELSDEESYKFLEEGYKKLYD